MRAGIRGIILFIGTGLSVGVPSVGAAEAAGAISLWQGLAVGMTPEEALPVVQQIGGVKRAKILKERKSNPGRRIDIDYDSSKVPIADLPFEIGPLFEGGRLNQVFLASRNQCGANAARVAEQLTTGLRGKYTGALSAPQSLSERDFRQAERTASTSGEPSGLMAGFANDDVAVVLTFHMKVEARPPYPTAYSKLGNALWDLANLQYEQRREECSGTGDRRMDVVLVYMSRVAFDAVVAGAEADEAEKVGRVADQL